nr:DUF2178 domain-containing protein [Candidatus Njordarchaeum guaymaensis]
MDTLWFIPAGAIAAIIVLIGVVIVWKILKGRRSGYPPQDERTQRITGKVATYALIIGQYFTIALLLVNIISQELYGSPAFEVGYALVASLLVSSLSFLILRSYFNRKGDF